MDVCRLGQIFVGWVKERSDGPNSLGNMQHEPEIYQIRLITSRMNDDGMQ